MVGKNYTKGEWKAGYNPGVTGPTTPTLQPFCGKRWPYKTINIGTETIAIIPAPDIDQAHKPNLIELQANANLIVSAVNACQSVNSDNPIATAEAIKDMYEALQAIEYIIGVDKSELSNHPVAVQMIREALAKAEGK